VRLTLSIILPAIATERWLVTGLAYGRSGEALRTDDEQRGASDHRNSDSRPIEFEHSPLA